MGLIEAPKQQRTLSDSDIEAITDSLEKRAMQRIDSSLGRGVRGYIAKIFFFGLAALLAAGFLKGIKP